MFNSFESSLAMGRTVFHQRIVRIINLLSDVQSGVSTANQALDNESNKKGVRQLASEILNSTGVIPDIKTAVSTIQTDTGNLSEIKSINLAVQANADKIPEILLALAHTTEQISHLQNMVAQNKQDTSQVLLAIGNLQANLYEYNNSNNIRVDEIEHDIHKLIAINESILFRVKNWHAEKVNWVEMEAFYFLTVINGLEDINHAENFVVKDKNKTLQDMFKNLEAVLAKLCDELRVRGIYEEEISALQTTFVKVTQPYPFTKEANIIENCRIERSLLCHELRNRIYEYFNRSQPVEGDKQ